MRSRFLNTAEGKKSGASQHFESSCLISCPLQSRSHPFPPSPTEDFAFILAVALATASKARGSVQLR